LRTPYANPRSDQKEPWLVIQYLVIPTRFGDAGMAHQSLGSSFDKDKDRGAGAGEEEKRKDVTSLVVYC